MKPKQNNIEPTCSVDTSQSEDELLTRAAEYLIHRFGSIQAAYSMIPMIEERLKAKEGVDSSKKEKPRKA